jgi:hypothetical protein
MLEIDGNEDDTTCAPGTGIVDNAACAKGTTTCPNSFERVMTFGEGVYMIGATAEFVTNNPFGVVVMYAGFGVVDSNGLFPHPTIIDVQRRTIIKHFVFIFISFHLVLVD